MNIKQLKQLIKEEVVQALLDTTPGSKMVHDVALASHDPFTGKPVSKDTDQVELLKKYIQNAISKELQDATVTSEIGKRIGQVQQTKITQPQIFPPENKQETPVTTPTAKKNTPSPSMKAAGQNFVDLYNPNRKKQT